MADYTFDSTISFLAPWNRRVVRAKGFGAGGGGGGGLNLDLDARGGGGGGGGAYASGHFSVRKGDIISAHIGLGGTGGGIATPGGDGEPTFVTVARRFTGVFVSPLPGLPPIDTGARLVLVARGGVGGGSHGGVTLGEQGPGGQASESQGRVRRTGGQGGDAFIHDTGGGGGGGGGSAETPYFGSEGENATTNRGGAGGQAFRDGGPGGHGANEGADDAQAGGRPGAGGGGGSAHTLLHIPRWQWMVTIISNAHHYGTDEVTYESIADDDPGSAHVLQVYYGERTFGEHGFAQMFDDIRALITFKDGSQFEHLTAVLQTQDPEPAPGDWNLRVSVNSTVTEGGVPVMSGVQVEYKFPTYEPDIISGVGILQVRDTFHRSSIFGIFEVRVRSQFALPP
jgi:hypothetical protein